MTPKEFLDRYTYLSFYSPHNFELVRAPISGYGSGWGARGLNKTLGKDCQVEYQRFTAALRAAHHGNKNTPCGAKFFFDQKPLGLIPPLEEFYTGTFIRAFDGKGSPDEMKDTLRIALAIGRIGTDRDRAGQTPAFPTAAAYAAKFTTTDCNGLVSNYYGDETSYIGHFASPARRRKTGNEVRVGDAIVTHCDTHPYEHIGLIQEWSFAGSTATVRLVEWGQEGDEDAHYSKTPKQYEIKKGPASAFGIGWETMSHKTPVKTFRYIFAPSKEGPSYGWF